VSIEDRTAREATRRLLRFARDKARSGFVRRLTGATRIGFSLKPVRLRLIMHGTSR
jgi:hypothetical protein